MKTAIISTLIGLIVGALITFAFADQHYGWIILEKDTQIDSMRYHPRIVHDTIVDRQFIPMPLSQYESTIIDVYRTGWTIGHNACMEDWNDGVIRPFNEIERQKRESAEWYRRRIF